MSHKTALDFVPGGIGALMVTSWLERLTPRIILHTKAVSYVWNKFLLLLLLLFFLISGLLLGVLFQTLLLLLLSRLFSLDSYLD